MTKTMQKILRRTGYTIAAVIISAALVVSLARLLTPYFNAHLPNLEEWSRRVLHIPVKIEKVQIIWNLYEPELSFKNVKILDNNTLQPKFAAQQITVNLSYWRSLFAWRLLPETIKISGVNLSIDGSLNQPFSIDALKNFAITDNLTGAPTNIKEMIAVIFSQPNLILKNINLNYHAPQKENLAITINELTLKNEADNHQLTGDVVLHQAEPSRARIRLIWQGDLLDLSRVSADIFLYLEGISLAHWFDKLSWHNLSIKQGVGSAKIWGTWDKNQWQEIQTQAQLYDLELVSSLHSNTQIIPRLSGHLGWKREGAKQIVAGDDILLDLSNHLWPTTSFTLTLQQDSTSVQVEKIIINFLDIADSQELLRFANILQPASEKILAELKPKGNLHDTEMNLANGELTGFHTEFVNVSFSPWQNWPGIMNASGNFQWQPQQGDITFNSEQTQLVFTPLLNHPLQFDHITGGIQWQKTQNGTWTFTTKSFALENKDFQLTTIGTLTLPVQDSPFIDATANFSMDHLTNISHYVPLSLLDPDFSQWLQQAFSTGKMTRGNAVIKGRLADFPFEKNNGTFQLTAQIKDLNLNYAPHWPALKKMNGKLSFVKSAMTIDVTSAELLHIPLTNIHAEIPYIGPIDPQILHLQTLIKGDFAEALNFIQNSPLKDNIGKDLKGLDLLGPMQLKLALIIPLKHPGATTVNGDINFANANLSLPEWRLRFDQLAGAVNFTQQSLSSTLLQGQWNHQPISLLLSTEHGKNYTFVKAAVTGQMSVNSLENWLQIPMSRYAEGSTQYQGELHLVSHDEPYPTEIFLQSHLQGIALNLPDVYGKKAEEARDLQLAITLPHDQPMIGKINYSPGLSGVVSLQKVKQDLKFLRGELRLGNGQATLPKENGLTITAHFNQLSWDTLQPYFTWAKLNVPTGTSFAVDNNFFKAVNLEANEINLYGQQLTNARLQIAKNNNKWLINIDSKQIAGRITLPTNLSSIEGNFQRIYLVSNTTQNDLIDPKTLPPLIITADDMRYGDKNFGRVQLNTVPTVDGLSIKQLQISTPVTTIRAQGAWQLMNKQYLSQLTGNIVTSSLNQMLNQLGMGSAGVIGSWANAAFDLSWPDAPYSINFSGLSGSFSFRLGPGRVVNLSQSTEAKIGIGRMLSIFSLQTIFRRLSLDFSDLFQNGYSFDSVQGNLKLKNGDAYTNDSRFDGPVARIDIAGRIGLAAKDYDLRVGVTTYVSSSLVPAALTAIFPPAGVATWVASILVTQAAATVSKMATYQYRVSGPWDNPVWQQVSSYHIP